MAKNSFVAEVTFKSKTKQVFDRFAMIDNVVVMGQLYGGKYLVDFCGCCSILGALDQLLQK